MNFASRPPSLSLCLLVTGVVALLVAGLLLFPRGSRWQPPVLELRRGVNLANYFEAPKGEVWNAIPLSRDMITAARKAGFDHIRLPVRWNDRASATSPYTIDPNYFKQIDEVVGWCREEGMGVLIDMHHHDPLMLDPDGQKENFVALWEQIAAHYQHQGPQVWFELLNEPNGKMEKDAAAWNRLIAPAIAAIRKSNPDRRIVIGAIEWNNVDQIDKLELPSDPNLVLTIHWYKPYEFTHQGADFDVANNTGRWLGKTWTGTKEERQLIHSGFKKVWRWSQRHQIPVYLGEFGVYNKAGMADRAQWTAEVVNQAEHYGFSWSYWSFNAGFGVYNHDRKEFYPELLKALFPK